MGKGCTLRDTALRQRIASQADVHEATCCITGTGWVYDEDICWRQHIVNKAQEVKKHRGQWPRGVDIGELRNLLNASAGTTRPNVTNSTRCFTSLWECVRARGWVGLCVSVCACYFCVWICVFACFIRITYALFSSVQDSSHV